MCRLRASARMWATERMEAMGGASARLYQIGHGPFGG